MQCLKSDNGRWSSATTALRILQLAFCIAALISGWLSPWCTPEDEDDEIEDCDGPLFILLSAFSIVCVVTLILTTLMLVLDLTGVLARWGQAMECCKDWPAPHVLSTVQTLFSSLAHLIVAAVLIGDNAVNDASRSASICSFFAFVVYTLQFFLELVKWDNRKRKDPTLSLPPPSPSPPESNASTPTSENNNNDRLPREIKHKMLQKYGHLIPLEKYYTETKSNGGTPIANGHVNSVSLPNVRDDSAGNPEPRRNSAADGTDNPAFRESNLSLSQEDNQSADKLSWDYDSRRRRKRSLEDNLSSETYTVEITAI